MDANSVAVATITWAKSAGEEARLSRSLGVLAAAGLPVAVADRGTSPPFARRLEGMPGFRLTVPREPGLVAQVKASVALAATFGTPFILYVEPDKELFFAARLRDFLRGALEPADAGVVIAERSRESFATFPDMQRYTEGVVNHLCGQLLERPGDYVYGPFLLSRRLLPHVEQIDGRLGWGWRPHTFLAAHRQGLRVRGVTGDYPCPPDQRHEDAADRMHRIRQLSENILGLIE